MQHLLASSQCNQKLSKLFFYATTKQPLAKLLLMVANPVQQGCNDEGMLVKTICCRVPQAICEFCHKWNASMVAV